MRMRNALTLAARAIAVLVLASGRELLPAQVQSYPVTRRAEQVDVYFGIRVPDPYRWLEDDTSGEVSQWVARQNEVTFSYLARIPFRDTLKARLQGFYNYPKYSAPFRKRGYYVYSRNAGLQNQSVLYIQSGRDGTPEVLLDPNTWSADGTVRLSGYSFSRDMTHMAYGISRSGSDWRELRVMDLSTRTVLSDRLRWAKGTGMSWRGEGFYYSAYDAPADSLKALSAVNVNQKVYFHRLGTPQQADRLVFADSLNPLRFNSVVVTEDERFEVLYVSDRGSGAKGNALWVRNVQENETVFRPIVRGFDDEMSVVENVGGGLLVVTDRGAPNRRLVQIDPERPAEEHWKVILPERRDPLQSATVIGGRIVATYTRDVTSRVFVYDLGGTVQHEVALPTLGSAAVADGFPADSSFFYTFTSFTFPPAIYEHNLYTHTSTLFRASEVQFSGRDYVTEQAFYTSRDGTRVPMFLVYRGELRKDGSSPTLLYGYGGFKATMAPSFNPLLVPVLDQGVVFALANIRGGGEYGEVWHEAGIRLKKQNGFDDFIAAAEYLIARKITSPEHLAIRGVSNGGLLVGAVMTQRPELFKVALPAVGVMDMLRFQKFTVGWNWAPDYGTSDDSTMFRSLYRYSPLHNVREGVAYPATLITTADHDDRVVPAHSFKFAAALQEAQRGPNPVLIRIETRSGHGASSTAKAIEEAADVYAFMLYNLGVRVTF